MDHDVALVLAGGLIAFVSSIGLAWLQHRWTVRDRRARAEREALDLTVQSILAWRDLARVLAGEDTADVRERLAKLDERWEIDMRLIPDHKSAQALLRLCKEVMLAPRSARESPQSIDLFNQLLVLADQVLDSAKQRYRDLS